MIRHYIFPGNYFTLHAMHIRKLSLTQFRNYDTLEMTCSSGINCIVGPNGAGKTNVLDAIHFLAFTRGYRTGSDRQAVKQGEDFFLNVAEIVQQPHDTQVQCNFIKGKGKKILVDQEVLKKMSEHIGSIPLVAMFPMDTELINGPSALRRKFLDMLISQYDPQYLRQLIQYDRILQQRNALLKLFGEQRRFSAEELSLWDMQLIPAGQYIYTSRQVFLEEFLPHFTKYFHQIVSEAENPTIDYKSQLTENTDEVWQALLDQYQEKDRVLQYSGAGIHRDDLVFKIDGKAVRNFGSQGQQKTFVISLKLAQYALLQKHAERQPILLLDDIFDKLDEHRLKEIAQLLDDHIEGQIFVTDTSYERLFDVFGKAEKKEVMFFKVADNQVMPIE